MTTELEELRESHLHGIHGAQLRICRICDFHHIRLCSVFQSLFVWSGEQTMVRDLVGSWSSKTPEHLSGPGRGTVAIGIASDAVAFERYELDRCCRRADRERKAVQK